jgi:hypothetical protein
MKVEIKENFSGYPDGKKRQDFVAEQVVEVPNDFAEMIISKGHAKAFGDKESKKETKRGAE